jgi:hypothetical protein
MLIELKNIKWMFWHKISSFWNLNEKSSMRIQQDRLDIKNNFDIVNERK